MYIYIYIYILSLLALSSLLSLLARRGPAQNHRVTANPRNWEPSTRSFGHAFFVCCLNSLLRCFPMRCVALLEPSGEPKFPASYPKNAVWGWLNQASRILDSSFGDWPWTCLTWPWPHRRLAQWRWTNLVDPASSHMGASVLSVATVITETTNRTRPGCTC